MGALSLKFVEDTLTNTEDPQRAASLHKELFLSSRSPIGTSTSPHFSNVNREEARALYDTLKNYVLSTGRFTYKILRPYLWMNVNELGLDPDAPWWGFEFETGYISEEARSTALAYCWDNFDNVTFDGEGEGQFPSEVTFAPENMSSFIEGTAPGYQFTQFLNDHNHLTNLTHCTGIGTHINISIPEMRNQQWTKDFDTRLQYVVATLNRTLGTISQESNKYYFGRERLYAGFSDNADEDNNTWLEGKLFRTTYDIEVFQRYVRVCHALTKVLQKVWHSDTDTYYFCSNILDMFEDPTLEPMMDGIDQYPDPSLITMDEWGESTPSFYYDDDEDEEEEWYSDDDDCECDDEEDYY